MLETGKLNIIDRKTLKRLINCPNITDMTIIVYLLSYTMANESIGYIHIEDFNIYRLYKAIDKVMPWINKQSVYNAVNRLIELNFFSLEKENTLIFTDRPYGFYKKVEDNPESEGHIKFYDLFLKKEFYDLQLRDKKILIKLLLQLDNKSSNKVFLNIKKHKHELMQLCKVNRLAHLRSIITRLFDFLNVKPLKKNIFKFTLSNITSSVLKRTKFIFKYTEEEFTYIKKILDIKKYKYNMVKLKKICHALHGYSIEVINEVIEEFVIVTNPIRNIISYVDAIAKRINLEMISTPVA